MSGEKSKLSFVALSQWQRAFLWVGRLAVFAGTILALLLMVGTWLTSGNCKVVLNQCTSYAVALAGLGWFMCPIAITPLCIMKGLNQCWSFRKKLALHIIWLAGFLLPAGICLEILKEFGQLTGFAKGELFIIAGIVFLLGYEHDVGLRILPFWPLSFPPAEMPIDPSKTTGGINAS